MIKMIFLSIAGLFIIGQVYSQNMYLDAKSVQKTELRNLVIYTKLIGYVKYFHPTKACTNANWMKFTSENIPRVVACQNQAELLISLKDIFQGIAPDVQIYQKQEKEPLIEVSGKNLVYWEHRGLGIDKSKGLYGLINKFYKSEILQYASSDISKSNYPQPEQPDRVDLSDSISMLLPILVESDLENLKKSNSTKFKYDWKIKEHRWAVVISLWNVIQHFFPYHEESKIDWAKILPVFLDKSIIVNSEDDLIFALDKMLTLLQDGHISLSKKVFFGLYFVKNPKFAFDFDWVEDRLVISKIYDQALLSLPGDVILKINDIPIDTLVKQKKEVVSFSNESHFSQHFPKILSNLQFKDSIKLEILDENKNIRTITYRYKNNFKYLPKVEKTTLDNVYEKEDGIWYMNLRKFNWKDFNRNKEKITSSKGLILDLRNYPPYSCIKLLSYFTDKTLYSGNWTLPIVRFPDRNNVEYRDVKKWKIEPIEEQQRIKVPIVCLIDGNAISFPEGVAEMIKYYKLAILIGESTAGTNGDYNVINIADYSFSWTGLKILQRDGSPYMGVGVKPDIEVKPTIESIRKQKDRVLEEAIKFLKEKANENK